MSVMDGPYLKQMQLLCVIWQYVCEQPALVCHGSQLRFKHELVLAREQIWNPFVQFKFSVYAHAQTYTHTCFALQSASLGLTQARPNKSWQLCV